MTWQQTPYTLPLFISALVSAALAGYIWQRRNRDGAMALFALICAVTLWATCYAMQMASADLSRKLLWLYIQFIGVVSVPALWLSFSLYYTGRGAWLRTRPYLLAIFPALTLLALWTNEYHHFFGMPFIWSKKAIRTFSRPLAAPVFGYTWVIPIYSSWPAPMSYCANWRAHRGNFAPR